MQSRSIGLVDAGSQGDALLTERSPDKCLPGIWGEFAALLSSVLLHVLPDQLETIYLQHFSIASRYWNTTLLH